MLKIIPVVLFLAFSSLHVSGQGLVDTPSTRLLQYIQQTNTDTGRVKFLLALSKQLILKSGAGKPQIDSAYALEKQAEQLSIKAKDQKDLGKSILMAALIENKKGDKAKGLLLSKRALSYFANIDDLKDEAEANIIIGQHYDLSAKNFAIITSYYKTAVALFRRAGEKERLATTLVDLADYQQWDDRSFESLKNLREALNIYKIIGFNRLTNIYGLIGHNLLTLGDIQGALKYELLSERSAIELKDSTLQLSTVYYRISECYRMHQDYKKGIFYLKKALAVANKYKDANYIFANILALAEIYTTAGEPQTSIYYLNKIKDLVDPTAIEDVVYVNSLYVKNYLVLKNYNLAKTYLKNLPIRVNNDHFSNNEIYEDHLIYLFSTKQYKACYPYLRLNKLAIQGPVISMEQVKNELFWFKVDSALGKYSDAIKHYQISRKLSDSMLSLAKDKQVALLQIEYETEKKDQNLLLQSKNIELLKNTAAFETQKQNTRQYLLLVVMAIMLIALVFGYNRYKLKIRNNLVLKQQESETHKSNVLLQSALTEKEWLLKEVHHRVKNNLQIVMSLLNSQSAYLENSVAIEAIRESQSRVQAISLIHQKLYKSNNMASINMSAYVADMIEYLANSLGTRKRHIRFEQAIEPLDLDITQAVPVGLILNESVTNAIKYAFDEDGGQIVVALQLQDEMLLLTIADNGRGFPVGTNPLNVATLGMEMMKALSKQLDGVFKIDNNNGVRLTVMFPREKELSLLSEKMVTT